VQPSAFRSLADPIYEAFYGLTDQPFAITTDPKFFYLSASHQQAFGELLNGLRRREGVLLLTGETGTGKTTLCRAVLESLGARTFSAMILNPYMSGAEVFRIVLRDFGLVSPDDLRRGALAKADVPQLLDSIETFLRSLAAIDSHAVIVLDEAQSLSPQVLDQIRLLTALEKDNRRLVQVVLCGQPALLDTLKTGPMLALSERITRRVTLAPLGPTEVHAYIQHRLAIAGGLHSVTFGQDASRVVAELSHGLPRRINLLCDRALEEGRFDGVTVMTPELVKRAARLVGLQEPPPLVPEPVPDVPEAPAGPTAPVAAAAPAGAAASNAAAETKPVPVAAPSLMLGGLREVSDAEPSPRRARAVIAAAAGIAVLLAAYTAYAWSAVSGLPAAVVSSAPRFEQPAAPAVGPRPIPSDEEIRALTPRPYVAPPPVASPELPDNPNELI
jgi:general secretion pathway protein A